jgi:hypothetical protein
MRFATSVSAGFAALVFSLSARAEQAVFTPQADATLFEDNPEFASGAGDFLFVGPIASGSQRRALLRFDLSSIPAGARVNSVSLRFTVDRAAIASSLTDQAYLHRVLAPWGEGSSNAGSGGAGTAAAPGDATWNHRYFGIAAGGQAHTFWLTAGGEFVSAPSVVISLGGPGNYTMPSTPQLVADVQQWLDAPPQAFGWILRGPEGAEFSQRARRIYSRNSPAIDGRPQLTVFYTVVPPGAATRTVPLPSWTLAVAAAILVMVGTRRR